MILLGLGQALAAEVRYGLFVGNDEGLAGDPELVFAESDAEKMRDLFVEYGGVRQGDAVLLQGATARAVEGEFMRLSSHVQEAADRGDEVLFVFYYSGHGDGDSLHLGTTKLEHEVLKTMLERTGATVRIAMVDACQSGGLVRRKGGERGPAFEFAEPVVEATSGTAIITSSAASELSQESSEIGGGFFTHYLHTALTGGADANKDGDVSLSEAYLYVHSETSFRTQSAPETQTPHWDLDLAGAGDVRLTSLEEASAHLAFLGDLDGHYNVWDESRKRYVAELDGAEAISVAVRPGTFYVHKRMPGWVEEAKYAVRRGETHSVLVEDFTTVSYASAASRGDLEKMVRRSRIPDLSLRFLAGYRVFGTRSGFASGYVAPHAVGGLSATFLGSSRSYYAFDLLTGGTSSALTIEGLAPVQTRASTTSVGAVIGVVTPPALLRAGIGGRGGFTLVTRQFPEWDLSNQSRASIGAGFHTFAGLHHGRFTADLQLQWQMLVMKWDDNAGWPTYADYLLVLGWRF